MGRRTIIAIVGSGSDNESAASNAHELGRLIAEEGWVLITGGRDAGVMKAANEGAKEVSSSLTIGIMPDPMTEPGSGVDVAIVTDTGEARNNIIVLSADVVVACGVDDPGTASEVSLAIKNRRPLILLEAKDDAKKFFGRIGAERVHVARMPVEALAILRRLVGELSTASSGSPR